MFSLIRPAKVEGHGVSAAHIHHSQGGKLLQLLREGTANGIKESRRQKRGGRDLQGSPSDGEGTRRGGGEEARRRSG